MLFLYADDKSLLATIIAQTTRCSGNHQVQRVQINRTSILPEEKYKQISPSDKNQKPVICRSDLRYIVM